MTGFAGADRYDGGAGDDMLGDSTGGAIVCGPGDDTMEVRGRSGRLVPADCESVRISGMFVRILRGPRTRSEFRWTGYIRPPCRVRVNGRTLRSRRAKRAVTLAPGAERVTLQQSQRCRGPFGSPYLRTAFRLTS